MDVDSNDPTTQTTITQGPSGNNQIIHVRQDSASELEALFNTVMNPNFKSKSLPMKARNLPKSFFVQPDRPRQAPHYHHSHSQSMGVLGGSSAVQINHSRSSSSDSNASHSSPAGVTSNTNNNNGVSVASPGMSHGSPMNGNLNQKVGYSMSPAQRRAVAHNQFSNARTHGLQIPQVAHSRSKSSPASLQLLDITSLQVKVSDIPPDMPLPPGWAMAKTADGQQYFMNHSDRSTTWEDPRLVIIKQQRQNQLATLQNQSLVQNQTNQQPPIHSNNIPNELAMEQPLPLGWEQASTPQGEIYFINHQTRSTSWVDPRLQQDVQQNTNTSQSNNAQLQQQLMKVNQMDHAVSSGQGRGSVPQQQGMLKYLVQDKEIMRRKLLKQHSTGGMDPFLGGSNSNFHQRDASLDSGVEMGNNYNLPRAAEEYLNNVEDMDTGDVNRRLHAHKQTNMAHMPNQQQAQHGHQRFPDFLDSLPASSVDFSSSNNGNQVVQQQAVPQGCPTSAGNAMDGADLVPTLHNSLPQEFDVESMLNNVKTENVDNGMIWL